MIGVADGYALASLRNGYTWIGWSDTMKGAFGWALDRAEHIGSASEVAEVEEKREE